MCVCAFYGLVVGLCWTRKSNLGLNLVQAIPKLLLEPSPGSAEDLTVETGAGHCFTASKIQASHVPPDNRNQTSSQPCPDCRSLSLARTCGPARAGAGLRCHAPVLLVVPEAWGGGAGQQEGGPPPRAELRGHCLHRHHSCFPWPVGARNEQRCLAALAEVCWALQLD